MEPLASLAEHLAADAAVAALDHAVGLRRPGLGVAILRSQIGAGFGKGGREAAAIVAGTALLALLSAGVGFVALPLLQAEPRLPGIWEAICSAAGLVRRGPATVTTAAGVHTSEVVVTPRMMGGLDASAIGRGATLAMACTSCHGAHGLSEADSPNLAGQYASAVYKQLRDYQSGARTNAVMGPRVAALSDQDMRDLAAYYAYLPRLPGYHPEVGSPAMPDVVVHGAPMRNIAPCAACHGGIDNKAGSAWLEGQSPVYLRAQLRDYQSGTRHNDISQQMRNVARGMTPAEIDQAAAYYASQPSPLVVLSGSASSATAGTVQANPGWFWTSRSK